MELPSQIEKFKVSIASILLTVPLVFGGFTVVDSRYVHASDLEDLKRTQAASQRSQDDKWVQFRRTQLEDQIFILQMKRSQDKLSPLDNALLDRYQTQLKDLKKETQ
jgi:hypothetical protein